MQCPSCSSTEVRRSHSRGSERILRHFLGRKMYHCWDCGRRFGVFSFSLPEDASLIFIWTGLILVGLFVFLFFTGRLI